MATFTIFGTGNMANAIGGLLAHGGATVEYLSHEQASSGSAAVNGDTVVLAVPYPSVSGIIEAFGAQLGGKTIVDITNPLNFETFDELVVPAGSSAAVEIQKALPEAQVVKAFNTNFAATLSAGKVGESKTTVFVAGDDAQAKTGLIDAVKSAGVAAVDVGALKRAHELEAIGFLQLTLAVGETISWAGGFALNN